MKTWVVGGTSGIGEAVAEQLEGAHEVWISGHDVDVRRDDSVEDFARTRGPFHGLVYSAGVNELQWAQLVKPARLLDLYDINVVGLLRVIQAVPSLMRVVVVGSDAARRPMRTSVAYCASKAALEMAVKVIARERANETFRINLVAPGMTDDTGMTRKIDQRVPEVRGWTEEEALDYERSQIPMQRRARPEEIAEVICSIFNLDTPYLNGSTIEVNGGR